MTLGSFLSPPAHTPEKPAEENRSASVHATSVAQFVGATGVIRCVNNDIISDQQIRQRAGHQCPLQHAPHKARRRGAPGKIRGDKMYENSHARRHDEESKNAFENFSASQGWPGDAVLSISHDFVHPNHVYVLERKQNIIVRAKTAGKIRLRMAYPLSPEGRGRTGFANDLKLR